MLKKFGVLAVGVTAGLVAAAPLASAAEGAPAQRHEEAGTAESVSNTPAIQAPVGESQLPTVGGVDDIDGLLDSNGQSLSGNGTVVNGQDVSTLN